MATTTSYFGFSKPAVASATDADLWGGQLNTNADSLDAYMKSGYNRVNAMGNQSGAVAVDASLGNIVTMTATGNLTSFAFTSIPTLSGQTIEWGCVIEITQDGSGSRILTVPAAWRSPSGAAATIVLSTTAGARDKLFVTTKDNGVTFDATIQKNWSA